MANPFDALLDTTQAQPAQANPFDALLDKPETKSTVLQKVGQTLKTGGLAALRGIDWLSHLGQPQAAKDLVAKISDGPAPEGPPQMYGTGPGGFGMATPANMDQRQNAAMAVDMATSPMSYAGLATKVIPPFLRLGVEAAKLPAKAAAMGVDVARGGTEARDILQGAKQGVAAYGARQAAKIDEVMNPKITPDAEAMKKIGASIGLTPEELQHPAIEYGENSVQARRAKVMAQGEGGGPLLQQHNAITEKIQNGFDNAVQKIGGQPLEPTQAGELIRQGVRDGAKRIAENVSLSHADVMDQFPGLMVKGAEADGLNSKLNGIEKFAKGRAERGVIPEQQTAAKSLLNSVESIRKSNGSYKQLNEAREIIGDIAFENVGEIGKLPAYQQKMRDLYFSINDALIGTVGKIDRMQANRFRPNGIAYEPLKDQLIESNKTLHEMFQDENAVGRALGNAEKAPEKIFNEALLYGDTRKAKALRSLLTPEQFQQIKGSYINALIKKGKDGFTYKAAKNTLAQNRSIVGELFANSPQELKPVKDIIDLGDRVGAPVLPGSAGQLDFGGANTLGKALHKLMEPVGDVTAEIGKVRSHAAPRTPRNWSGGLPLLQATGSAAQLQNENLPPHLRGAR